MTQMARTDGVSRGVWWTMVLLATAALLVSGYLTFVALMSAAGPVGCGAGSGCLEVLGSRWSKVLGVPVSALAAGLYLLVLAAVWSLRGRKQESGKAGEQEIRTAGARAAWGVLYACAAAIIAAATWFTFLQAGPIGAWCPWCMVGHGLGLVLAGVIVWSVPRQMPRWVPAIAIPVGGISVAALVIVQSMTPATIHRVAGMDVAADLDVVEGTGREVTLLNGALRLVVEAEPHLGPADAEHVLAMLFDYGCPHCRRTHGAVHDYMAEHPGEVVLVALPAPLNRACNPYAPEAPGARFDDSCELGRIGLAVHAVDAAQFEAFDAWMWEPELPRSAAEARAYAAELVGESALAAAMSDDRVQKVIERNVQAYGRIHEDDRRLPVTLVPGQAPVLGAIEDAAGVAAVLAGEGEVLPGAGEVP